MEKLNLNSDSIINIEVNDKGESITINLSDREFPTRFYGMYENIGKKVDEINSKKDELESLSVMEQLQADIEIHKSIMYDIDNLLGEGTCKKVFGDIVPDISCICEFFEQLVPIIQKYSKKRQDRISKKYSPNRKGAM